MSTEEIQDESKMQGSCEKNKVSVCLAVVVIILLVVLLGVAFLYFKFLDDRNVCSNFACMKSSAEINEFIDASVNPCEDFYGFVCGKFEKIAYEKQINNLLNAERERMTRRLDKLIVMPISREDPTPVKDQKTFFQFCLDEDNDEDRNKFLLKKLGEIGGWPLIRGSNISNWDENNFDWMQVMINARSLGLPFEWFLKVDLYSDSKTYELKLSPPENCKEDLTEEYFTMRKSILETLTIPGIDLVDELPHLDQFEKKLQSICANTSDDYISLSRMSHLEFDRFNTAHFLKILTGLTHAWERDSVLAFNKYYINRLKKLLRNTTKTDQANYILWKIVEYFAPYLSQAIRETYIEYIKGTPSCSISRFDFCIDDTKSKFKQVFETVHLQEYVSPSVQDEGKDLVSSIKSEIVNYIEKADWQNNKVKEMYLEFYKNLETVIGFPEKQIEDEPDDIYLNARKAISDSDNIFKMLIKMSRRTFSSKMRMIGGSVTEVALDSIHEANSQFTVVLNDEESLLIVPAYAFDSFLYNSDRPKYLNYAGLGTIVGNELTKGLLTKTTTECLIENLETVNKTVNALPSINLILAQELAYRAYQSHAKSLEETEKQLINLDYTPNQLFWIKSSLNWCYHRLPEEDDSLDRQEFYKFIVSETAKNSVFFASVFNCSSKAAMNPENKCQLL